MNGALSDFWNWLNANFLMSSESIIMLQKKNFVIQVCFLLEKSESNSDNKNHHDA